jgi:hypothetical protein
LERLVVANWLILPCESVEEETAEDADHTKDWRSRDIPFQYMVFTGFENNGLDDDFIPPTNKAELREFEARYGVPLYAYEYHRAVKDGKIESLAFDIRHEGVKRDHVPPRYYDEYVGLKLSSGGFNEDDW